MVASASLRASLFSPTVERSVAESATPPSLRGEASLAERKAMAVLGDERGEEPVNASNASRDETTETEKQ